MKSKFFVPFKTAKLLKEKGYPQEGATMYYDTFSGGDINLITDRECVSCVVEGNDRHPLFKRLSELYIAAPTYHEVLDWLEENGIYITTLWNIGETDKEDTYEIWWKCFVDITLHEEQVTSVYHTREEALNAGILAALKML